MSTESVVVEEKECALLQIVRCPICVDVVIDPVTTECGHSLCRACLAAISIDASRKCPSGCGASVQRSAYSTSVMLRNLMDAIPEVAAAAKTRLAEIEEAHVAVPVPEAPIDALDDAPINVPERGPRREKFFAGQLGFLCVVYVCIFVIGLFALRQWDQPGKVEPWPYSCNAKCPPFVNGKLSDEVQVQREQHYDPSCAARPNAELSNNITVWGNIGHGPDLHGGAIMMCHERHDVLRAWARAMTQLHGWNDSTHANNISTAFPLTNRSIDGNATAVDALCVVVIDSGFSGEYRTRVEFWHNVFWTPAFVAYRLAQVYPLVRDGPWSRNKTRDHCHCLRVCDDDISAL